MIPKLDVSELAEDIHYERAQIKTIKKILNGFVVVFMSSDKHPSETDFYNTFPDYYIEGKDIHNLIDLDEKHNLCLDLIKHRLCSISK